MRHTVLLVDDDADVLHSLRRVLHSQPYLLYTACSGEEAASVVKAASIDVVVADERLPGMSGTDLLAWIAHHYPGVVRMILTGHAVTETVIRAINEGGVYRFFTKPYNVAHLAIAISKAIEHRDLLAKQAQLVDIHQRQAGDRMRFGKDLEAINRLISRDLQKPLQSALQSCQSLLEQHRDLFDPTARSLIEGTLDAMADMQSLVEDLLARVRGWQSTGLYRDPYTELQESSV